MCSWFLWRLDWLQIWLNIFSQEATQRFVSWHYFQERLKSRIYLIFIKRVSEASGDIGRNRSGVCLETRVYLTPRRRRHKFSSVACFLKLTEMRFFFCRYRRYSPAAINLINFALKAENLFHFRNLLFLAFLLLGCFFARLTKSSYGKKIFIWIRGTSATRQLIQQITRPYFIYKRSRE